MGCTSLSDFAGVTSLNIVDDLTVHVNFDAPKPNLYRPFMSYTAPIIQKARFEKFIGAKVPECADQNFYPIGTRPFVVTNFRPNDVIQMNANYHYLDPAKPTFVTVTFTGGCDASAAGRSVLETGEFDYAWNLQLAREVVANM